MVFANQSQTTLFLLSFFHNHLFLLFDLLPFHHYIHQFTTMSFLWLPSHDSLIDAIETIESFDENSLHCLKTHLISRIIMLNILMDTVHPCWCCEMAGKKTGPVTRGHFFKSAHFWDWWDNSEKSAASINGLMGVSPLCFSSHRMVLRAEWTHGRPALVT